MTALASKNQDKISVVITNYDQNGRNNELVPVRFTGLVPGKYDISKKNLNGQKETSLNVEAINGEINLTGDKAIVMSPNSIISLDLTVSQNTE